MSGLFQAERIVFEMPGLRNSFIPSVLQAYIHSRMRAKTSDFLKVLNRARPEEEKEKKLMRYLALNAPIATKVCFSRLLKCLRSLYGKQYEPRLDCSYRSSLFWVHAVSFYTKIVSNFRQLFAADDFTRRHFQMHFFLGAFRVNPVLIACRVNF